VRVDVQTSLVLGSEEVQAAVADLRVIDGCKRIENRTFKCVAHISDDGLGGLFGNFVQDDRCLLAAVRQRALLQVQDECRSSQHRGDGIDVRIGPAR
jgi:hypothetical protein